MIVDIGEWDATTRATWDRAMLKANGYWQSVGENKALTIENGPPTRLIFTYNGVAHEVHTQTGGFLFWLSGWFDSKRTTLTYWCTMRVIEIDPDIADPSASPHARNGFVLRRNGQRIGDNELASHLVHELTHKQQEINSSLGWLTFGLGYVFTLGMPYEREARDMGAGALAWARAQDAAAGGAPPVPPPACSVTLTGPSRICLSEFGTFTAAGLPAGGSYRFTPGVQQTSGGLYGVQAGHDSFTVRADAASGTATVTVEYTVGACRTSQSLNVSLCERPG